MKLKFTRKKTIYLGLFALLSLGVLIAVDMYGPTTFDPASESWRHTLAAHTGDGMLVCCIWIAINWYRRTSPPSQSDAPYLDEHSKRMLLVVGGGLFGFLILIGVIGFYGAILVFLIYYIRYLGRHGQEYFCTVHHNP